MAQATGPRKVQAVREWLVGDNTMRIAIEVTGEFEYRSSRLHNPERLYFDILNAKPWIDSRRVYSKDFDGKLVSRVRVAETARDITRLVLDLLQPVEVSISKLTNPARLIVDLRPANVPAVPPRLASTANPAAPPPRQVSSQEELLPVKPLASANAAASPAPSPEPVPAPGPEPVQKVMLPGPVLNLSSASAAPGGVASMVLSLQLDRKGRRLPYSGIYLIHLPKSVWKMGICRLAALRNQQGNL